MVVGGFAATLYGEPRFTVDVDVVAAMGLRHLDAFVSSFPVEQYYVSEEAVRDALRHRRPFNIIHGHTGTKVDVIPLPGDAFSRAAFARRTRMLYDPAGHTATFISAEDVILAKLTAHRQTRSDKHLRDARGVLLMQWDSLDRDALRNGAKGAGLTEEFGRLWASVEAEISDSDREGRAP
jgi:hypothetical protein